MSRRLHEAIPRHVAAAQRPGFRWRVRVRMITMTIQHSGDLARDRAELVAGWEGLRKQLHRWFGRALPFALFWETEPGRDGLGHVHAHCVVIGGPEWWNYRAIQRTWHRACPRSAKGPGIQINMETGKDPGRGAAYYLAKYASKGAKIGGAGWSDELVAQTLAIGYGKRWITTSEGFWAAPEPICQECGEHVHRAAPPHAWARVARHPEARGPPQIDG
jgi:hypothetical protein